MREGTCAGTGDVAEAEAEGDLGKWAELVEWPVRVVQTAHAGRGLAAARDVAPGEVGRSRGGLIDWGAGPVALVTWRFARI